MATKLTFDFFQNIIHVESGKIVLEAPNPSYKKGILSTAGKTKIRKMNIFWGMKILWIFFGSSQHWTIFRGHFYAF